MVFRRFTIQAAGIRDEDIKISTIKTYKAYKAGLQGRLTRPADDKAIEILWLLHKYILASGRSGKYWNLIHTEEGTHPLSSGDAHISDSHMVNEGHYMYTVNNNIIN